MKNLEFEKILKAAVSRDTAAIEKIIKMYEPLINSSSIVNGKFDEDLKQELILHIIQNINKFDITFNR